MSLKDRDRPSQTTMQRRRRHFSCIPSSARRAQKSLGLFVCGVLFASIYAWYYRVWMNLLLFQDDGLNSPGSYSSVAGDVPLETRETSHRTPQNTTTEDTTTESPTEPVSGQETSTTLPRTERVHDTGIRNESDAPHTSGGVARFANGTLGYVADPASLQKGIAQFLKQSLPQLSKETSSASILMENPTLYWKLLTEYESQYRNDTASGHEILSSDYICAPGPGRGYEQDSGYKLLTEKIKVYSSHDEKEFSPRILCLVYTYPRMRDLQRTHALSWGHKCDGYLAFSTETIPSLGIVHLEHEGEESYSNMWQKSRSIWTYIYQHYRNDYDFFHLGGDDLYVIVENMRNFLSNVNKHHTNADEPIYLGQWIPQPGNKPYFVSGGPGYTLNRAALSRLVEEALPKCRVHLQASYEDRLVSSCLGEIGIVGGDTRDWETGEQLYHDCSPAHLYTFRSTKGRGSFHAKAASFWETLRYPNSSSPSMAVVGPKHGLEAAGTYSVSFHDIYHPLYMARLHSLLYKQTCPATSPLGRALSAHGKEPEARNL